MSMTLVETKTLGSAAASIEFTSIPQDGTDLYILYAARNNNDIRGEFEMRFNGVSTGYTSRNLIGNGSTTFSFNNTFAEGGVHTNSVDTANTFSNGSIYIPNYSGTTAKSYSGNAVQETNGASSGQNLFGGLSSATAAITSVRLLDRGSDLFVAGSTFSLYKITKGSSGGVVVS